MKKVGLIVNPIAGMGGSVGLKGTDNVVAEAIKRGAVKKSSHRCIEALRELADIKELFCIYTASGEMGENEADFLGLNKKIIYLSDRENTTSEDTALLAKKLMEYNVDIIVFVGGDGTARDLCDIVDEKIACIGVPAGVKIHSPVYAVNPKNAGMLVKLYLTGQASFVVEKEVIDIDENEYRNQNVKTRLYGYLSIPYEKRFMQNKKSSSPLTEKASQNAIAEYVIENMEENTYYLVGPGSTTRVIMERLGLKNTLIGFDMIYNKKLVQNDLTETDILSFKDKERVKLIITPIGGQGFLLGRGNQQISSKVIEFIGKENIIAVASKQKLASFGNESLLVDIDESTNKKLAGYIKVICGYNEITMCKIVS